MSFDTTYPNRKDWRKPYRRAKRFDRTCRNHGSCGYCRDNRLHRHHRRDPLELREIRRELAESKAT